MKQNIYKLMMYLYVRVLGPTAMDAHVLWRVWAERCMAAGSGEGGLSVSYSLHVTLRDVAF